MRKRGLILFLAFAAVFAVGVPVWAIGKEGAPGASPEKVAASDQAAKDLFATNCGSCHTLARAGTDGVVGPNLDELIGNIATPPDINRERVLDAIEMGIRGRMPAGILRGSNAEEVADFVSRVAGE